MNKVNVYIDWFNLYHSLRRYGKKYYWLDVKKLSENYLEKWQEINQVYFFTAYPIWNSDRQNRHKIYVNALQSTWVKIRLWKFQKIQKVFNKKNHNIVVPKNISKIKNILHNIHRILIPPKFMYITHEEKETDVNISVQIMEDAFKNSYESAIIISWDSDLISPIISTKKLFPNKKFKAVLPIWWYWKKIKSICWKTPLIIKSLKTHVRRIKVFTQLLIS